MSRWKKILAPVLVFVLGILFGVGGTGIYVVNKVREIARADTSESVRAGVRMLTRRLELNPEQRAAARPIFEDLISDLGRLRAKTTPELRDIIQGAELRLRPILNDSQRQKLRGLLAPPRARWERIAPTRPPRGDRPAGAAPATRPPAEP